MSVKLVVFDAGDILYTIPKKEKERLIRSFVIKHKGFYDKREKKIWKKLHKKAALGKMSRAEAIKGWLRELGLGKEAEKDFKKVEIKLWKLAKRGRNVNRILKEMKKKYKLAVLSDSSQTAKEKKETLRLTGVDVEVFDKIFTSHDIGYEKPHPKSYLAVLKYFGVKPEEAVFIGHDRDEIEGAKRVGMVTISLRDGRAGAHFLAKNFLEIKKIVEQIDYDIEDFLGKRVTVKIDRPLGSKHPEWKFMYPTNYGYVEGYKSKDGENLDAYVLGVFKPLKKFRGECIAIIRRLNDREDKLVVVPKGKSYSPEQIEALVEFQERWFKTKVITKRKL